MFILLGYDGYNCKAFYSGEHRSDVEEWAEFISRTNPGTQFHILNQETGVETRFFSERQIKGIMEKMNPEKMHQLNMSLIESIREGRKETEALLERVKK